MFRNYNPDPLFGDDYYALRNFLIKLDSHNYHFGRWDWMITHSYLDKNGLPQIGLWEANGEVVAAATYDCRLGIAFLLTLENYRHLKKEMLLYAKGALAKDGKFKTLILDGDMEMHEIAENYGFYPTQDKEQDAVYPIDLAKIHYTLPEGFKITSMAETYDLYKYGQVLWKGFNHEANGEGPFVFKREKLPEWEISFKRPNVNLEIKIAVVAPNGDFVSYCGMWHDAASQSVLVEPVATDPAYRKMGLGRAAVLEAVRRCGKLGAKRAFVGSSQQFYYNIGFKPYANSTWWEQK
ncbi:MAG: GNAT family N-acetyltransferase [Defluviitaleaceae bacterium]|nr:GNAT family N-acetyltransferase [Defluviitaleaceae bacterium]MCL2836927.1 GNAT family N-acetyltransferase [Defluviitaleaceae bacterium]